MTLRLLTNENFPLASVRALRCAGFDVFSGSESLPGAKDDAVLKLAADQGRILLTFDRDYGELVYHHRLPCPPAIVYLRFDPATPTEASPVA